MRAKIPLSIGLLIMMISAHADEPHQDCFRMSEWRGWRASGNQAMYFRVAMHDVFRIELASSAALLQAPIMHLVSQVRGGDLVCSAIDLDLKLADDHGMTEPLFVQSIRKLSPQEIAAIPDKERP